MAGAPRADGNTLWLWMAAIVLAFILARCESEPLEAPETTGYEVDITLPPTESDGGHRSISD